jgi:ABC-2 type transport system ATP-binding protein
MNNLAIELEGVCKSYRFFELDKISLHVPRGTIMGLIGPNGAGKSTTIRILMGLVHQDRGSVRVLGHRVPEEQVAAKWDIGFASDDMRLYDAMTLGWHMKFMQSIYESWDAGYAQLLLKRFGLRAEQKMKGLSHGQRVKAALLLVFARRPKLLVLDEPTTGLDPVARHEILRELTGVMADEDRTVLFSSQNTQDIEQISDQITFIDRGHIIDSMDKEAYLDRWRRPGDYPLHHWWRDCSCHPAHGWTDAARAWSGLFLHFDDFLRQHPSNVEYRERAKEADPGLHDEPAGLVRTVWGREAGFDRRNVRDSLAHPDCGGAVHDSRPPCSA